MKINHLTLGLLLCFGIASAQTAKISGKIQDPNQKPVANAFVLLLQAADNSLVKTEITPLDGSFNFENLKAETYLISIDESGYESFISAPITIADNQSEVVNPILKTAEAKQLSEVVVQKKRPLAEYKIDRTVVNVDAMISTAGSDAMDVLEKSPGIIVDQNGTITFKGKSGVMVFIDDKPTYLSGAELEAYLKALPASTLDQIELITNPPAKYEAAGTAGIINIKTKKSKLKGFNGNYTARGSIGKRGHARNSLSLNYMENNVRVFGNIGYSSQQFLSDLSIYRQFLNPDGSTKSLFDQNTILDRRSNMANLRTGMYFYASEKTTWGINLSGVLKRGNNQSDGRSTVFDALGVLDSTIVADNSEKNQFKNGGINLNFSHDFPEGRKWSADADYLVYNDKTKQRFNNFVYQPDNSLSSLDESTGVLPSQIDIYAFKTDYVHPLPKDQSFEAGYKISYSRTDNTTDYDDVVLGLPMPNFDMSNHFKYDEVVNAVYVNYSRNFKRFSIQAGLRMENTISKGHQLGNEIKPASKFRRDYTNLFPTLYLMYKLDSIGNNQLVTSYGKRINRPYYQDLNPFISPLDKFTFYTGNPYLDPQFSHSVELSYRYKSLFNTTLSYSHVKDEIGETLEITNGIYFSRPGNLAKSEFLSLNVQSEIAFAQWLSTNVYSEVTYIKYDSPLYTEYLRAEGTFFYCSINNRFKFGKGWSGELGGNYISAVESAQVGTRPKSGVNCGVQKKILKDKGSLRFTVNDIFYSQINAGTINNLQNTYANYINKGDTRYAALTFTYAFGKTFESKDGGERSGAESEQNRVK